MNVNTFLTLFGLDPEEYENGLGGARAAEGEEQHDKNAQEDIERMPELREVPQEGPAHRDLFEGFGRVGNRGKAKAGIPRLLLPPTFSEETNGLRIPRNPHKPTFIEEGSRKARRNLGGHKAT